MCFGFGHMCLWKAFLCGDAEAEGRKESWKESKKVVMGFYTRRESDDCSFILLA